ncbi:hypothetical protein HDU81_004864 [Chytriomyces hyalinus]|nr:hypothetical protein HDU81_004864 [Chytriomyces hyalinus]
MRLSLLLGAIRAPVPNIAAHTMRVSNVSGLTLTGAIKASCRAATTTAASKSPASDPSLSLLQSILSSTPSTTPKQPEQPIARMRRLLDANTTADGFAAWRLACTSLDAHAQMLTQHDINRLLLLVAGGALGMGPRAQRDALEKLFALFSKDSNVKREMDATTVHVMLEARVADGDMDGVANLLLETVPSVPGLSIDADLVINQTIQCLAKNGHFDAAETLLDELIVRHVGVPKLKGLEMDLFLQNQKNERDEELQKTKRRLEENLIMALHAPKGAKTEASNTESATEIETAPVSQIDQLVNYVTDLARTKPFWRRHPPVRKDASPTLIRKRTRPTPPVQTGLIIRTYNALIRACASTNPEKAQYFLEHMKTHAPRTNANPNNVTFSICMQPFVLAGNIAVASALRDEALARGLKASLTLDAQVLRACIIANDAKTGREQVARISKVHSADENATPSAAVLKTMMQVYALDKDGSAAEEAWGVLRTVLQSSRGKNVVNVLEFSKDLIWANGTAFAENQNGADVVRIWDEWFQGIGQVDARIRYGTGIVGFSAIGNMPAFKAFLVKFDEATAAIPTERVPEYSRVLGNLVSAGKVLEAAEFYESARTKNVNLGASGYTVMIRALAAAHDVEGREMLVSGLVERMIAGEVVGRRGVLDTLKKEFGEDAKVAKAYETTLP